MRASWTSLLTWMWQQSWPWASHLTGACRNIQVYIVYTLWWDWIGPLVCRMWLHVLIGCPAVFVRWPFWRPFCYAHKPAELDVATVIAMGFPPYRCTAGYACRGGLSFWADLVSTKHKNPLSACIATHCGFDSPFVLCNLWHVGAASSSVLTWWAPSTETAVNLPCNISLF
jgi:hypothetical protein